MIGLKKFRDLTINEKIGRAILYTSLLALLISSGSIIVFEYFAFRRAALDNLVFTGEIIGSGITGAVAFGDAAAADLVLSRLSDQPSIIAAQVYDNQGKPFATYVRSNDNFGFPSVPFGDKKFIAGGHLKSFQGIYYRKDRIGTIYLESDMRRVHRRLTRYSVIVLTVLLLLLPFVYLVSKLMEKLISDPLRDLAVVAEQIATKKTYTLRATYNARDDIGRLIQAFNYMLDSVDTRDKKLVQQAEELWRSNKELEQFAYISSHDLQEPLRKITTYSQLLEMEYKDKIQGNGQRFINNICTCVDRMRNLIDDLLAYSRATRAEQRIEKIDLRQVLAEIINDLEFSIKENNARVVFDTLPIVQGNVFQMKQLFQNLISNAIKFHGAEPPLVRVTGRQEDHKWVFGVHDNGIGIESRYFEQIFKVFQRLHRREIYPGTGIGLAICKKIVEQYGGTIWIESTPGKGSTFYFTWPLEVTPSLLVPSATAPKVIDGNASGSVHDQVQK